MKLELQDIYWFPRKVLSVCLDLISACPSWFRSWPYLRRVGGTCWRWCMRNRRGGPTRFRATPASAACALRSAQPAGSSESLRIPCSSLSGPSTVIGITNYRNKWSVMWKKMLLINSSAKTLKKKALFHCEYMPFHLLWGPVTSILAVMCTGSL